MTPSERFWGWLVLAAIIVVLTPVWLWLKGKSPTQQRKIGLALFAGFGVLMLLGVVFGAG